jgi:polyisoprenoid-binding protein YceI
MCRSTHAVIAFALLASLPAAARAADAGCTYKLDPGSVHIGWTAYKTTKKAPVKGEFKKIDVKGPVSGGDLAKMLKATRVSVDPFSSDSGNAERDTNLSQFFFHKIEKPKVEGRVSSVKGGESGTFDLKLTLDGKKRTVAMTYQTSPEGDFTASGSFDMLDFGMKAAFDSIHQACLDRHKGDDGVSKTWSEVEIRIAAKVAKTCP